MSFDLDRALRRLRRWRSGGTLVRRERAALPFIDEQFGPGPELLFDTTVYIDTLQGRWPKEMVLLTGMRIGNQQ